MHTTWKEFSEKERNTHENVTVGVWDQGYHDQLCKLFTAQECQAEGVNKAEVGAEI